jgi:hypothetical protein
VWVVVVVSLGSRTVEGAIQAGIGFIFFERVVLRDWIPWLVNNALVPLVLVIALVVALRLLRHRLTIPAGVVAAGAAGFSVWYLVADPGWDIGPISPGVATVFFGLGAITYAKHPEGILEHNKRASMARTERLLARLRARNAPGTPPGSEGSEPQPVTATAGVRS